MIQYCKKKLTYLSTVIIFLLYDGIFLTEMRPRVFLMFVFENVFTRCLVWQVFIFSKKLIKKISYSPLIRYSNNNCKEYVVTENVDGTNLKILLGCSPCRGNTDGLRGVAWNNVTLSDLNCDGGMYHRT